MLETFVPNLVSLTNPRSSYIGQNSNCHNSRTSNDIGMKLGQLTKHDKKNTATPKKIDDVMPANCDIIVTFQIYGQFGTIRKLDSKCMVCKTCIFINSNLLSCKNWNRTKNALNKGTIFDRKMLVFREKKCWRQQH